MKKILLVFAVATFFAACGDNSSSKTNTTDSTGVQVDTTSKSLVDTTNRVDTSANKLSMDTSHSKKSNTAKTSTKVTTKKDSTYKK